MVRSEPVTISSPPAMPVIRPSTKFGSGAPASTSSFGSAMASGATAPIVVAVMTVAVVPSTALDRKRLRPNMSDTLSSEP